MSESVLSKSEKLGLPRGKLFDLLQNKNLIPLIEASGTPIELFINAVAESVALPELSALLDLH